MLKNIIGNSVKYARQNVRPFVKVHWYFAQNELKITITDNGEGIKEVYLPKIFDMFFRATTTGVGTGLGLYICKEIANKLNGEIHVTSKHTEGSVLSITLPILKLYYDNTFN